MYIKMENLKFLIFYLILLPNSTFAAFKFSGLDGSLNLDQSNSNLILENDITGFNGTLRVSSNVSNNVKSSDGMAKITFQNGGVIQTTTCAFDVQGTYDPNPLSGRDKIFLSNNGIISTIAGENIAQDIIVEAGSSAKIVGTPSISGIIALFDQTSSLELNLDNGLSTSIILNGGTINLANSLKVKDEGSFVGDGLIQLNNYTLDIAGLWTGNLTFANSGDVQLHGPTVLNGIWDFSEIDGTTILNGNSMVLNLSGGTIRLAQGHELIITDLIIQGLGLGGNFDLFDSPTTPGKITLRNVSIELEDSYTLLSGLINVKSGSVKFVTGPFSVFIVNGPNTKFVIDGVSIFYDTLAGNPQNPLTTANGGVVELRNNGVIRTSTANTQTSDFSVNAELSDGKTVFIGNRDLNLTSRIVVKNVSSSTLRNVTIDGQNSVLNFPHGSTLKVLTIDDNTSVTLQNLLLKNFSLDNVLFGINSSLNFGDGTCVNISEDINVVSSDQNFSFVGNASLQGLGQTITLNSASNIVQRSPAKTLEITGLNIKFNNKYAMSCQDSSGNIKLENCTITLGTGGFEFDNGNLMVENLLTVRAADTTLSGFCPFKFSSTGNLSINSGATLEITRAVDFIYQADPAFDGNNTTASKRHLIMTDKSSTIFLDGCSLTSSATALALDRGNLIVDNKVTLNSSFAQGEAVEFSPDLNTQILADAQFVINGKVQIIQN